MKKIAIAAAAAMSAAAAGAASVELYGIVDTVWTTPTRTPLPVRPRPLK